MPKKELRSFITNFQIEKRDDGKEIIVGHAARFNELSEPIMGFFKEKIAPGAFKDALKDVRALFNHRPENILGRQSSGTLKVYEDEMGLRYEIDPPDTQVARDLLVSIKRGDIKESSFAFLIEEDEWEDGDENSLPIRTIKRFKEIFDVSPVTFPAYKSATVGMGYRNAEQVYEDYKTVIEKRNRTKKTKLEQRLRLAKAKNI